MHWITTTLPWILASFWATVILAQAPAPNQTFPTPAFTYDNSSFLLHGSPFVIIGGQMDPQRIPPIYWRDRLSKARAMGLNTIFSYVYWNLLEPVQGQWTSSDPSNDVVTYFRIAQEEGLHVVLRPGPYICGEREWGGFPAWLSQVPGMVVRTYNEPFLAAAKSYLERLADDLKELQVSRGGPLLMVQVENEYGSYGENHNYTAALRDILLDNYEIPLYTNDGGVDWTLAGGEVPGALAAIDGDPSSGFRARDMYITDPSELGPLMDGEYYTFAPDFWGSENVHNTTVGRPEQITQFLKDLDFVLGANNSISLYMFHGGTNFAFSNGAIWKNFTAAFTTSYDYGSPLDESGRTNELYFTLRDKILEYVPEGSVPEPVANLPRLAIPSFGLRPVVLLFNTLGKKQVRDKPETMEAFGQAYGMILYEHHINATYEGKLQPGDRARDRVMVYVNEKRVGVIDSTYRNPANVSVFVKPGDKLQLLVENLGRVDYWSRESGTFVALEDPYKGIVGDVAIGNETVGGWDIYCLTLDEPPEAGNTTAKVDISDGVPPAFYQAKFWVEGTKDTDPTTLDTFVAVPTGVKGNVWVNGFNLGRYWIIGPQQSLYLPGTVLVPGTWNEVVVLELEPTGAEMTVYGADERKWGNNPDPDAP
ncbi:family 35 glycoside hydrolase [Pseudomassariella vexata]|uniref:Beta-galactosidase n=1 Tax=Pseudomassariella vexata TaxID=1141098 RepID=A0A1Y2DRL5_9PEZI|nr:family 35 glycoside hydrolase [Pseudomassariella vexata]ORY61736.1 family 35 glycoside hydrolase [Pseudomassariella vexata]